MGWNYERGEGEVLESYCHRIESVLSLTVGQGVWGPREGAFGPLTVSSAYIMRSGGG